MAGLGLSNAVNSYMQGKEWAQGQQEYARQQQQRAQLDEANKAATGVIEASKAEWALNGAQGQYRPNETTMFKAAEARGMALAKAGMWDKFLENDAQVAPMRIKARAGALQQYEADGDIEKLARTVYPTLFDGKEIVGTEKIQGADGSPRLGLMPIPSKIKLKLSDGTSRDMDPQELVTMVKTSLIDPVATAKKEVELNYLRAKEQIELAGKIKVEEVRGDQARKTEGVKGEVQGKRDRAKFGYDLGLAEVNNTAAQKRTDTTAGATLGSARIGADGRIAVAEAKAASAGGSDKAPKRSTTKDLQSMIEDSFGVGELAGLSGKRAGSPTTAKILEGTQAYLRQFPDATEAEAMNAAAAKLGFKAAPVAKD